MRVKNLLKALPIGIILSSFCFAAYASSELDAIMKARGLSEKDILAAAKTYQPSGRKDEYLVFSSGGQSGQGHRLRCPINAYLQVHRSIYT